VTAQPLTAVREWCTLQWSGGTDRSNSRVRHCRVLTGYSRGTHGRCLVEQPRTPLQVLSAFGCGAFMCVSSRGALRLVAVAVGSSAPVTAVREHHRSASPHYSTHGQLARAALQHAGPAGMPCVAGTLHTTWPVHTTRRSVRGTCTLTSSRSGSSTPVNAAIAPPVSRSPRGALHDGIAVSCVSCYLSVILLRE
jgi:hypothetical protein